MEYPRLEMNGLWGYSHFSFTRLELYNTCPQAYKNKYIDRIPERESEAVQVGRITHEIIAAYDNYLLANRLWSDITKVPEITMDVFFHPKQPHSLGPEHFEEINEIMDTFSSYHFINPDTIAGIEEQMIFEIMPEVAFWVVLDRLEIDEQEARITDYKTTWRIAPPEAMRKNFQLRIYAWAVHQEYPQIESFLVGLEYVRLGIVPEPVKLGVGDISDVDEMLKEQINRIMTTTEFKPKPGSGCAYCSYSENCPAGHDIAQQVIIKHHEDAIRVAEELAILKKQVADREAALKSFCEEHGPVDHNGISWGFYPVPSKGVKDIREFMRILEEEGWNPYDYVTVSGTALKKLLKNEELAKALQPLLAEKSYTKFEGKKSA